MGRQGEDKSPYESESDDAPESIPLSSSKASALSKFKKATDATIASARDARSRRRALDAKLKEQAAARAEKVAVALKELLPERPAKRTAISPTKVIFNTEEAEEEMDGEDEDCPVVVLRKTRVSKSNLEAAKSLTKSKNDLLMLRNARTRVRPSVGQAYKRYGRPASRFLVGEEALKKVQQVKRQRK